MIHSDLACELEADLASGRLIGLTEDDSCLNTCLRRLGSIKPSPEITFGDGDRREARLS
jgi:hypothetical protein